MKKTLKISIFSIALGTIAGIILNNTYKEKLSNSFLNEEKTYYFIQEGVYSSTSSMQENTKDLLVKTVDSKNDKQYVYLGITRDEKNAKKLKETVEQIPLEHILLETDCPYMAPEPHRGSRNDSRNIPYVIAKIAEIKGVAPEEVEETTRENAFRLFSRISEH